VTAVFAPFVELVKTWDLPGWLVHWGHPGNMVRYVSRHSCTTDQLTFLKFPNKQEFKCCNDFISSVKDQSSSVAASQSNSVAETSQCQIRC
jgi:hypothetical protein